ncbi:hypothetical protein [Geodermatophilus obscurus]|uniref:hypothetical protein n=1 Tax=Geodermatophilus obscurus TaxID=1861 RepID=UPI000932A7D9|nr:hypothetical protein [Geodermatophilus obscurus]
MHDSAVPGAGADTWPMACRVEVVPEHLAHANSTTTLTVHQRVHPGTGRQAAGRSAALLDG